MMAHNLCYTTLLSPSVIEKEGLVTVVLLTTCTLVTLKEVCTVHALVLKLSESTCHSLLLGQHILNGHSCEL